VVKRLCGARVWVRCPISVSVSISVSVTIGPIAVMVSGAVPRGCNNSWAAVQQCRRNGTGAYSGGNDGSRPSRSSAATTTLLPRRARAWARSGGGIGIANISAVGTGADGVADGVANNIVIAVLVSRDDNNLSASGKIDGNVTSKDTAMLIREEEGAGSSFAISAHARREATGNENEVPVGHNVDVSGSTREVNTSLERRVREANDSCPVSVCVSEVWCVSVD